MSRGPQRHFLGATLLAVSLAFPALAAAEPVAVVVETQKGKPIEGAKITVRTQEGGDVVAATATSDEGIAIVNELGGGEWYFEIDRPGFMLYTAYVRVRIGKKPELGFASQVSRGDDWEPMRVKIRKASTKLTRQATVTAPPAPRVRETVRLEPEPVATDAIEAEPAPEPDSRPDQRRVEQPKAEPEPPPTESETVVVPSTVETVEPESVSAGPEDQPRLEVADGDPEPLTETGSPAAPAPQLPREAQDEVPDRLEPGQGSEAESPVALQTEEDAPLQPAAEQPPPGSQPIPPGEEPETAVASPPAPETVEEPVPTAAQPEDGEIVEAPVATPPPPTPALESASSRFVRSAAAGDCPECGAGEWAVSASVQAATAGDTRATSTCADELPDLAAQFTQQLAGRQQQPFAGPLMAALWRTGDDPERAALAEIGARLVSPDGFCQVAGVVLPAGATVTGYSLEAWDELGGRACSAEGICALPKAGWSGSPTVVGGQHATVVYAVFRNRSTRHQRNAELTVLFTSPGEWR